jgi:hypothetical protein
VSISSIPRRSPGLNPLMPKAEPGANRAEVELPVSGFQLIVVHQPTGRVSIEIRDSDGLLTGVVAAAPLGRSQIRGAVRGNGWSLAYGQVGAGRHAPVVRFSARWPLRSRQTVTVRPTLIGRFWVAEVLGRHRAVELRDTVGAEQANPPRARLGRFKRVRASL